MSTETVGDVREAKLPKWAQDELRTLRRRTREAEKLAEEARVATGPDERNTLLLRGIDDPIGLGDGVTIRFVIDAARYAYIDVRFVDGQVDLNTTSGRLAFLPSASNAARAAIVER